MAVTAEKLTTLFLFSFLDWDWKEGNVEKSERIWGRLQWLIDTRYPRGWISSLPTIFFFCCLLCSRINEWEKVNERMQITLSQLQDLHGTQLEMQNPITDTFFLSLSLSRSRSGNSSVHWGPHKLVPLLGSYLTGKHALAELRIITKQP